MLRDSCVGNEDRCSVTEGTQCTAGKAESMRNSEDRYKKVLVIVIRLTVIKIAEYRAFDSVAQSRLTISKPQLST